MAHDNGIYRDGPILGPRIPISALAASPVSLYGGPRELPLDLIQKIISLIEDVADISRLTRTSRLLYYMALPRLYEHVTLKCYPELRYIDGEPEGYGGGSPFSMGLLGLVTGNVAGYVKRFTLTGEWRERDLDEFSKGRVPDNSMMLNIATRAAMDRMALLDSFSWDLNTKPMQTVYHGLAMRPTLTTLRIKFPTKRIIRPTCVVPPIPTLKALWLTDMDPLCYPDDFSVLLLQSKKLEELQLQWSPRMREEGEPSINLQSLFGKCHSAGYQMGIKRLGLMNNYAMNRGELDQSLQLDKMERVSFINCIDSKNPKTVFVDQSWDRNKNARKLTGLKMMRGEGYSKGHAIMTSSFTGLEEFYIVSKGPQAQRGTPNGDGSSSNTISPAASNTDSVSQSSQTPTAESLAVAVAADYLAALTQHHGQTLRIILLSEHWQLNENTAVHLAKSCPNMEQLGFAPEDMALSVLRKMMPYAPNLFAIRLLNPNFERMWEIVSNLDAETQVMAFSFELTNDLYKNVRWIGQGPKPYEVGGMIREPSKDLETGKILPYRRVVKPITMEKANRLEIWRMDVLELAS